MVAFWGIPALMLASLTYADVMKQSRRGSGETSGGVAGPLACTPKWSRYIVAAKVRGDVIGSFNVEFHVLMYLGMQQ